jgi:hypothetical protein
MRRAATPNDQIHPFTSRDRVRSLIHADARQIKREQPNPANAGRCINTYMPLNANVNDGTALRQTPRIKT